MAAGSSLDSSLPLDWAAAELQPHLAVQGNLDPDPAADRRRGAATGRSKRILDGLGTGPVRLQSRPRHPAGDAARACRASWSSWSASWHGERDDGQARRRAVQSRRARQAGGGRALSVQPVQRSGDHPPAAAAALAARPADLAPARARSPARSTPISAAARRCWPIPRPRPRRWRRRCGAGERGEGLHRHALLASVLATRRRRRCRRLAPDRDRAAAALSAIFDDDDGILARGLGAGRDRGRADGADPAPSAAIRRSQASSRRWPS